MILELLGTLLLGLLIYGLFSFLVWLLTQVVTAPYLRRGGEIVAFNGPWVVQFTVDAYLLLGYVALAALSVRAAGSATPLWGVLGLHAIGFLASFLAYVVNSFAWRGGANVFFLPVALLGYLLFVLWPALPSLMYGWFFGLIGLAV